MAAFKAYLMRVSPINWRETMRNYVFLTVGALMMIVNFNLLMTPGNIAPGGMGGLSLILNYYTGIPRGVGMLLMSTPLIALGFWQLGRFRFLVRTLYVTIIYTIGVDLTARFFPAQGIVDDLLLTALFGGVLGGIGYGLVVHGRGMVSGTGIISRVIQLRTGIPLSQLYVFIDGFVIIALGLTFGWERALYGLIMLFVWGLASDYVLEGPSVVRVVFIVTDLPEAVGAVLMERLRPKGDGEDRENEVIEAIVDDTAPIETAHETLAPVKIRRAPARPAQPPARSKASRWHGWRL